jgi:hypothetical protein
MSFAGAVLRHMFARVLALFSQQGNAELAIKQQAKSKSEQADELRRFAESQLRRDPGFAQDLFAAATRHEQAA